MIPTGKLSLKCLNYSEFMFKLHSKTANTGIGLLDHINEIGFSETDPFQLLTLEQSTKYSYHAGK